MKKSIILSALFATLLALPASLSAQRFFASIPLIPTKGLAINIGIDVARPGAGYVWIDGYWDWDDYYGEYVWVPGTWALPPHAGWVWMDGYWEHGPRGYVWISGYWANPYRPDSYYVATHRHGGGYAPYFVRNRNDHNRYTSVFVSGNNRFDHNRYFSDRYNRPNAPGSYDRIRRDNRVVVREQRAVQPNRNTERANVRPSNNADFSRRNAQPEVRRGGEPQRQVSSRSFGGNRNEGNVRQQSVPQNNAPTHQAMQPRSQESSVSRSAVRSGSENSRGGNQPSHSNQQGERRTSRR